MELALLFQYIWRGLYIYTTVQKFGITLSFSDLIIESHVIKAQTLEHLLKDILYTFWFYDVVITALFICSPLFQCLRQIVFDCISFACHDFRMPVTYQHIHSLDILFSGCPTSDTKTREWISMGIAEWD